MTKYGNIQVRIQRRVGANAAGRLLRIFTDLTVHARNSTAIQPAWQKVLNIDAKFNDTRDDLLLVEGLQAIGREIDVVDAAAKARDIPDDLIGVYLQTLRATLGIQLIYTARDSTLQHIKPEALLALQWCSFVLPDDDMVVSTSDMEALKKQIDELDKALQAEGIPDHFRKYATGLLDSLKKAMFLFPIEGLQPLRTAVRKAVTEAHFEEEEIKADLAKAGDKPEVRSALSKLGATLKTAASTVGDAEKLMKGYGYMLEMATKAGEFLSNGANS